MFVLLMVQSFCAKYEVAFSHCVPVSCVLRAVFPLGEPEPEVTWLKGDTPLKPDEIDTRIEIEFDAKDNLYILIVHNAELDDTGEYTINAENIHGSMSVTVKVIVTGFAKRPEKPKEPEKEKVIPEMETTFTQESFTGATVTEATVETRQVTQESKHTMESTVEASVEGFIVTETKAETSETVSVEGTITEDTVMDEATAAVVQEGEATMEPCPPEIIIPPKSVFVDVGETIFFFCKVKG